MLYIIVKKIKKITARLLLLYLLCFLFTPFIPVPAAEAFQEAYLRLDRMRASTTTGGLVCARPNTTGTEADVQVVFPTGFTVNATAANWTVTTTNLPSGTSAWIGIGTATAVSGQTVTFPSGDLVVGTTYCFNFSGTNTLTTSTAGSSQTGTIRTRNNVPATIDTRTYATAIISDDQIAVTATVPAIFTFTLGGNTAALGTLSTATVTSATGITLTIATNATAGWIAWVRNTGLTSAATGQTITSPGTVDDTPSDVNTVTGVVLDVDITTDSAVGTGTVSQAAGYGAEYNGTNTTSGGTLSTTLQPIARSNGTTDGDVLTLLVRARVTAVQAAATDYADTLTVVGAGRF
jgi:hypothetical protein